MLLAWVIPVTAPGKAGPAAGISPAARSVEKLLSMTQFHKIHP